MEEIKKTLLVGLKPYTIVELEYVERDDEITFSREEYDRYLFTEKQGEDHAWEYLLDSDLWEQAVVEGRTVKGRDEWYEEVLNIDGWMEVLGDVEEIEIAPEEGEPETYLYCLWSAFGQINDEISPDKFDKLFIPKEDLEFILEAWDKYHMKDAPQEVRKRLREIFAPNTRITDLGRFVTADVVNNVP